MKTSFSRFLAIALAALMVACIPAVADTTANELTNDAVLIMASDADLIIDSAVASDSEAKSDSEVISDAEVSSDSEVNSDSEIASDSETASDSGITSGDAPSSAPSGNGSTDDKVTSDSDVASDSEANSDSEATINFSDLSEDDWAYESIVYLANKGIVSGDSEGTIRPDGGVTREEVAKMMVVARGYELDAELNVKDSESVADWAKGYFAKAIEKGIISGYTDGTVRGNGVVNRAEMATIIVRSINASTDNFTETSFTDITADDWYAKYVECAKTLNIVNGYEDGTFRGEAEVTRREAFAMISRMVKFLEVLENN